MLSDETECDVLLFSTGNMDILHKGKDTGTVFQNSETCQCFDILMYWILKQVIHDSLQ
jgi:hypothetical protein